MFDAWLLNAMDGPTLILARIHTAITIEVGIFLVAYILSLSAVIMNLISFITIIIVSYKVLS